MAHRPINPQAPRVDQRHRLDVDDWVETGRWVNVRSSNVSGISFIKEDKVLFVSFKSGSVYQYDGVPERVARGMFTASSVGKYLHHIIKQGGYHYTKIR